MTEELLNYFNGDELAASTWLNKYAKRDKHGNIVEQTPADMHKRMAKEFARIEKHYDDNVLPFDQEKFSNHYHKREPLTEKRIFELFDKFKYVIPAGSVMAGLGAEKPVSLSNCFVLPSPEDSYSSIMMTRLNQAELMKRRGGVGYDLSNLRPRGATVNNAAVTSTGAASFMNVCSDVTNEVAQQGRRGALMLSCFSPDTFIKTNKGWIKIFNLIENIKNGEQYKAWTEEGYKDIIATQEIPDRDLYEVSTIDGKTIKVTADHKFVVHNKQTNEEYLKELINIDIENEELVMFLDE